MRVEVKDDDGALMFSIDVPPKESGEACVCPAYDERAAIIEALQDAATFLRRSPQPGADPGVTAALDHVRNPSRR